MKTQNNQSHQLEALQNAVSGTNIDGLEIHHRYQEDKRKTTPKFFLLHNGASISPVLDYNTMNHFILGLKRGAGINSITKN